MFKRKTDAFVKDRDAIISITEENKETTSANNSVHYADEPIDLKLYHSTDLYIASKREMRERIKQHVTFAEGEKIAKEKEEKKLDQIRRYSDIYRMKEPTSKGTPAELMKKRGRLHFIRREASSSLVNGVNDFIRRQRRHLH